MFTFVSQFTTKKLHIQDYSPLALVLCLVESLVLSLLLPLVSCYRMMWRHGMAWLGCISVCSSFSVAKSLTTASVYQTASHSPPRRQRRLWPY